MFVVFSISLTQGRQSCAMASWFVYKVWKLYGLRPQNENKMYAHDDILGMKNSLTCQV